MFIDPVNPVDLNHPLNRLRESWWLSPTTNRFTDAGKVIYDLMGKHNATHNNTSFDRSDGNLTEWYLNAGSGPHIDVGNYYDYTDNFTFGATFQTKTLTPGNFGNGATIIGKNIGSGSAGWLLAQVNATLLTNGSVVSGSVLSLGRTYRAVVSTVGGTVTIYLDGVAVASGSTTAGSTTDAIRFGLGVDNWTWVFDGWISDCFVSSRGWSASEARWDADLVRRGYRGGDSPLRWIQPKRAKTSQPVIVSLTTDVVLTDTLLYASAARLGDAVSAYASASGIGPIEPEGPAFFEPNVILGGSVQGGVPTLVSLATDVVLTSAMISGEPVELTTNTILKSSMRSIPNGNRKILAQNRYRR